MSDNDNGFYVYAVFTGPRSNRKIKDLYATQVLADGACAEHNATFHRQTPASVGPVRVISESQDSSK